jgi:flagellar biosynthesis/type III secretory pathway chaperone
MQAHSQAAEFVGIAAAELAALKSFIGILEQERDALSSDRTDALAGLAVEKSALVEHLADCARKRECMLQAAGVQTDKKNLGRFLKTDPQAQETWGRVVVAARRAAELNAGNSFLVNQRLAGVNRALGALGGTGATFYDTRGTSSHGLDASRSLGRV